MRAVGARSAARAASLIASTGLFALYDSGSPAFAACAIDTPTQLFAGPGQTCSVSGKSYDGDATNIAVQASGAGAVISWTSGGPSTILTSGDGLPAVQADSGGSIEISGGAIQTSGAAAPAVLSLANGGGGVTGGAGVMLSGGTTILTSNGGSPGLAVSGAGASLTATGPGPLAGVLVKTTGMGSIGASNGFGSGYSPGGVMNLTNTTIDALGEGAHAVAVSGAGSVTNLGVGDALTTQGNGAYGLFATSGGVILAPDAPSTATSGTGAIGVYASGPGASISVVGAPIVTGGDSAAGLEADGGGQVTASGGSVTTSGVGAPGLSADGAGSKIMATNVAVTTNGGFDPRTGSFSFGVIAFNGGSATVSGGSITTTGPVAHGVFAFNGGGVALNDGATILTTGGGSFGLFVNGASSSLTATGVSVTTTGGLGPSFGDAAIGAYNGFASPGDPTGGAMTLTDTTMATTGMAAIGVETNSGGVTNISGGAVNTSGEGAHALFVTGTGSTVNLSGATTFATQGDGAIGLYAAQGGIVDASGQTTIATSGRSSASTGLSAYGVNADGAGSQINLAAANITTTGVGAAGLYASDVTDTGHGGAITVSGPLGVVTGGASAYGAWAQGAGSTIALNGPSAFAISGNASAGLMAAAGGLISATGPTSIAVSGAGSTGVQALSGAITASGALNVTTLLPSSTAFALQGISPSIIASGGGTISAAGAAIAFTNAANAVATFDNFNIKTLGGDLILADPSTATVNFNHTLADAGAGNLLNATLGSTVAFNANASTLTGAIQTDPTSTTNISLTNGTNWTMSASSTATNLSLANSAIVFSPSGGFKTLTVGSYVGTGANITLNTALGGANAGSTDQLIINGGSASGSTALTIKNASGGAGSATTGAGIPVVVATSGGTTSPGAFYLANGTPILAGGYEYTLGRDSNQDWYLTSSPAATTGQIQSSVTSLAQAQLNQLITSRLLGSLLLGANEQVSGCACGGGFASIGSFSLGSHGRWSLNDSLTLLAGAAFEQYYQDGANVRAAPIVAASLRYDPPNWGKSRPFLEFGGAASPYIDTTYTRYYTNGLTPAQGVGSAVDRSISVFGRVGWVDRLTPIDEAAVFTDLVRGWQQSGGYTEAANALNPFPATVSTGVDRQDVVRFGATYTHLLFGNLEANINGAIAYGFDNEFGSRVNVVSFGSVAPYPLLNSAWTEFGGRLGYRFSRNLVVDAFLIGTLGGEIGPTLHAGLGVRYAF